MIVWIMGAVLAAAVALALAAASWRSGAAPRGHRRVTAAALAVLVPGLAFLVYAHLGKPEYPDQPYAERARPPPSDDPRRAEISAAVDDLAERMKSAPNDARGWMLLGRSFRVLDRHLEAAKAFARARALEPDRPEIALAMAEAMVIAQGGVVSDDALTAFTQVIEAEPDNGKALYFLGLGWAQRGHHGAAVERFRKLLDLSPADAPWVADVRTRLEASAKAAGIDPDGPSKGPTAEDVEAASKLGAEERAAMIRGMVDGLAARLEDTPDDLAGWRRLARAYRVLGETGKAEAAEARVRELEND